ncbi:MAG: NAD(P)-binding protein, partial [Gemmatimonadetes bacterium]|nr:NAD(P)-binding protein [Gemmatimonadota bacterium]
MNASPQRSVPESHDYDDVVIGSGFGGAMVAYRLVASGRRVLLLERGDWAVRGESARDDVRGFFQWTAGYDTEA